MSAGRKVQEMKISPLQCLDSLTGNIDSERTFFGVNLFFYVLADGIRKMT